MAKPKPLPLEPKQSRALYLKMSDSDWEKLQHKLELIKDETGTSFAHICTKGVEAYLDKELKRLKLEA